MPFQVTVEGDYHASSNVPGKGNVIKKYKIVAVIPTMYKALSTIKNKVLSAAISKQHPDYVMYRTYHVTKIHPTDAKSKKYMSKMEIKYMDREALLEFITEHNLPVEEHLYPSLFKLREAVQAAKEDPEKYIEKLELNRESLEMDLTIASLNPELYEETSEHDLSAEDIINNKPKIPKTSRPKRNLSDEAINKKAEDRVAGLRHDMIKSDEHRQTADEEIEDL